MLLFLILISAIAHQVCDYGLLESGVVSWAYTPGVGPIPGSTKVSNNALDTLTNFCSYYINTTDPVYIVFSPNKINSCFV